MRTMRMTHPRALVEVVEKEYVREVVVEEGRVNGEARKRRENLE